MVRYRALLDGRKPIEIVSHPNLEWFLSLKTFPHMRDRSVARFVVVNQTIFWGDAADVIHDDLLDFAKGFDIPFALNGVLQRIKNEWRLSEISQIDFIHPDPGPYLDHDQALARIRTTPGWECVVEALECDPTKKPFWPMGTGYPV